MAGDSYVKVARPWEATIGRSSPHPAAFYAALIGQTLRFGMPATRRGGKALAVLGRRGVPEAAMGVALRRLGRAWARPDATADGYLQAAREAWPGLADDDDTLPAPGELDILVLRRAVATTIFLFAGDAWPALVGKVPLGDPAPVERETSALRAAAASSVGPHAFGPVVGLGHVQRGLRGRALHIEPLTPEKALRLSWTPQHDALARGLERLARDTVVHAPPAWWGDGVVNEAASHPSMTAATRNVVAAAVRRLREHPAGVLCHVDTSPQNLLFDGDRFTGMVDWEIAVPNGMPGRDLLNAASASIENGVALVRWDERSVVDTFVAAWLQSPFGRRAREAAGACVVAAGLPSDLVHATEIVFFARRVGHRMRAPDDHATSIDVALAVLEAVCAGADQTVG